MFEFLTYWVSTEIYILGFYEFLNYQVTIVKIDYKYILIYPFNVLNK